MGSGLKTFLIWASIFLGFILFWDFARQYKVPVDNIDYSEFQKDLKEKRIKSLTFNGTQIEGQREKEKGEKRRFITLGPPVDREFLESLSAQGVEEYKVAPPKDDSTMQLLLNWLPMIAFVALFFILIRNLQVGGGKAMSFGKSRARLVRDEEKKATFKDVAGIPEAKEELQEIVEFLKDPKKFQKLGGRIPKGVLLMGAPGTGKTLVAKAIAGEANVPFFSISGSDFVEMFVGVGASRVRDLFQQARKAAPCLIFIDEIDAVGRHRGAGIGGGHDEREQTLNALLVEMDGFQGTEGIIILASTNRPDVLDPALLRAGRFDRRVVVPRPELKGREEILKVHAKKLKMAENVDLGVIARGTPGFVGADLENICNEAALIAARANKEAIEMVDFEKAKDKVMMGAERKSLVLNDKEKRVTAVHEAGHALVAKMIPGTDPVHKVTIIPRGMALGLTMQLPEEDRHNLSVQAAAAMISIMYGGRAAEELLCDDITTGAGNDIERATEMARRMVTEWGMSKLGPVALSKKEEHIFLGKEIGTGREYSEKTAVAIDEEIKRILEENFGRAKKILRENVDKLQAIADALLERETLDGSQIDVLISGVKLEPVSYASTELQNQPAS